MSFIEHSGEVVSVDNDSVTVSVEVGTSCSSCSARSHCVSGNGGTKRTVTVPDVSEQFRVGDKVKVQICSSLARTAVLLCYVVPILVLLSALFLSLRAGVSEAGSAVISLASLSAYYACLWLSRNRISRNLKFYIYK